MSTEQPTSKTQAINQVTEKSLSLSDDEVKRTWEGNISNRDKAIDRFLEQLPEGAVPPGWHYCGLTGDLVRRITETRDDPWSEPLAAWQQFFDEYLDTGENLFELTAWSTDTTVIRRVALVIYNNKMMLSHGRSHRKLEIENLFTTYDAACATAKEMMNDR